MKANGRIAIEKLRVLHYKTPEGECHICGADAYHAVMRKNKLGKIMCGKRNLKLCTPHFVRMFKVPANRFPKQKKEHTIPKLEEVRTFTLRRHMDMPYTFTGERLGSYEVKIHNASWYYALYRNNSDGGFVASVTRAKNKQIAIHMVEAVDEASQIIEKFKFLLHCHGTVAPISDLEMPLITIHMTRFFEEVLK